MAPAVLVNFEELKNSPGNLQERFHLLNSDIPFVEKIREAHEILRFNQRQTGGSRLDVQEQLEKSPLLAVLKGLLRWILSQMESGASRETSETNLSSWALLAHLIKWTPIGVLGSHLTRISLPNVILQALQDVRDAQSDNFDLFSAVSYIVGQIRVRVEEISHASSAYERESLKIGLASTIETAANILGLAYENLAARLGRLTTTDHRTDEKEALEALDPFIYVWKVRRKSYEGSDDDSIKSFCARSLGPSLLLLGRIRQSDNQSVFRSLETMIDHYALDPIRKRVFALDHTTDEQDAHNAVDDHLSGTHKFAWADISGESDPESAQKIVPAAVVLLRLALRKLPTKGAHTRGAEESWALSLFVYLSQKYLKGGAISRITDLRLPSQHTLKNLVALCTQSQLKIPRSHVHNIMRHVLREGDEGYLTVPEWYLVRGCLDLDPDMFISEPSALEENTWLQQLLFQARRVKKLYDSDSSLLEHDRLEPLQDPYEASMSGFVLPWISLYFKARKFSSFIAIWRDQMTQQRKETTTLDPDPLTLSVWADKKVRATVASNIERSLLPDQLRSVLQQASKSLHDAPNEKNNLDKAVPAGVVISTVILGITTDAYISATRTEAKILCVQVCRLLLSKKTSEMSEGLWAIMVELLERWPEMFANGDSEIIDLERLVKKAMKSFIKILDSQDAVSGEAGLEFGSFAFLWTYSNALISRGNSASAKELPSTRLLKKVTTLLEPGERDKYDDLAVPSLVLAERCVEVIAEYPDPLTISKQEDYVAFLKATLAATCAPNPGAAESPNSEVAGYAMKLERSLYLWSQLRASSALQRNSSIIREVQRMEAKTIQQNIEMVDIETATGVLWRLNQLFRHFNVDKWTADLRFTVANDMIKLITTSSASLSDSQLMKLLTQLLLLSRGVIDSRYPEGIDLKSLLEERQRQPQSISTPRAARASESPNVAFFDSIYRCMFLNENISPPALSLVEYSKGVLNEKNHQAAVKLASFTKTLETSSIGDKQECIKLLISSCKQDVKCYSLLYALCICNTHVTMEGRDAETKALFADLITELTHIASKTRSVRRAALVLRCLTQALRQNAWAVSQHHIEDVMTLLISLTRRKGNPSDVDEPAYGNPNQKSNIDLPSARRMLLGSLGLRVPKTKEDEAKLRQRTGADKAKASDRSTEDAKQSKSRPSDVKLAAKLYSLQCSVLTSIIQCHRVKLSGRWHLVGSVMRSLLGALFESHQASIQEPTNSSETLWLVPSRLTVANASEFSRHLEALCDPTPSSIRPPKRKRGSTGPQVTLNDETKKAKAEAGKYMSMLLKEYCRLRLEESIPEEKRVALNPGLYAVLDAMPTSTAEMLNTVLLNQERDIFRGLMAEWRRDRKRVTI